MVNVRFWLVLIFVLSAHSSQALELKMNELKYCPETPYELWYPFSKTGRLFHGYMDITPDTVSFSRLGQFKYTVHTTPHGFTYMHLHDFVESKFVNRYIYLQYSKSPYTYSNQSCMLDVHDCTTQEGIEKAVLMENKLPYSKDVDAYCNQTSFIRDVDRDRMFGLVPLELEP